MASPTPITFGDKLFTAALLLIAVCSTRTAMVGREVEASRIAGDLHQASSNLLALQSTQEY